MPPVYVFQGVGLVLKIMSLILHSFLHCFASIAAPV